MEQVISPEAQEELIETMKKLITFEREPQYDYYGNRENDNIKIYFAGVLIHESQYE